MNRRVGTAGRTAKIALRLYVAARSPNSLRAIANINSICRKHLGGCKMIEIIDVLEDPLRTLRDGVFVTPTLVRVSPAPMRRMFGDLGDTARVLDTLGIDTTP